MQLKHVGLGERPTKSNLKNRTLIQLYNPRKPKPKSPLIELRVGLIELQLGLNCLDLVQPKLP